MTNCTFASGAAYGGTNGIAGTGSFAGDSGSPGTGYGANIANGGGVFLLKNSILAYPTNALNSFGGINDGDNNISSDGSPVFTQTNSHDNLDPELLTLGANGGPTMTLALQPGSPAIDAIYDSSAPAFDQRGLPRPVGPRSDIGAYEYGVATYSIAGEITLGASAYPGVEVVASNGTNSFSTMTDANGNYALTNLPTGSYVLTPQPAGYFNPANLTIIIPPGMSGVNFASTNTATTNATASIRPGVGNGLSVQLSFAGTAGVDYRIQASTDLVNWQDIVTNYPGTNGVLLYTDGTTNFTRRFYRAITP